MTRRISVADAHRRFAAAHAIFTDAEAALTAAIKAVARRDTPRHRDALAAAETRRAQARDAFRAAGRVRDAAEANAAPGDGDTGRQSLHLRHLARWIGIST